MQIRSARLLCLAMAFLSSWGLTGICSELWQPVAIEQLDDGRFCVLNRNAGSISLIDPVSHAVSTHSIASNATLTDFAVVNGSHATVVDAANHELIAVQFGQENSQVVGRVSVPHTPVNVIVQDGYAFVSSLWSHQWSVVQIDDFTKPVVRLTVNLPFAPRHQIALDGKEVLVLDAFGGRWARIDYKVGKIIRAGEFAGSHNITGIAFDHAGRDLIIPHMTLNAEKPTTKFNVHWGDIVLNVLRTVPAAQFKTEDVSVDAFDYLGRPDLAAGDPTGILITRDDRQIVCFAGTSQVGISDQGANSFNRVDVGNRPSAMTTNKDQTRLFVTNQMDDTVSVVNIERRRVISTINLRTEGPSERTLAQQGERHFYDSTLSSDGWFSCHSCHTDGHTNGGLADTFGDGATGDAKRVPSLLGAWETGPWSWKGNVESLQEQVDKSLRETMRGPHGAIESSAALTEFIRRLETPPSVAMARNTMNAEQSARGRAIFESLRCNECHRGDQYTSDGIYTVKFHDESGNREFNPPSLRGVSHRDRLLHDNRAKTVRDVIERLQHQNEGTLSEPELRDLVYFVEGL